MADANPMWKQAAAGVISGLVLLGIGWIAGLLPTIWGWILCAYRGTLAALLYNVAVPVWVLFVGAVVLLVGLRLAMRQTSGNADHPILSSPDQVSRPSLGELEEAVVQALVRADGNWVTFDRLADEIGVARLLLEQSIEKLYASDFLLNNHNYVHGTSFRLSSRGRDYAISHGFLPGSYAVS